MNSNDYAALLDRVDEGIVVLDRSLRVRWTNRTARAVLERLGAGEHRDGTPLFELVPGLRDAPVAAALDDVAGGAPGREIDDVTCRDRVLRCRVFPVGGDRVALLVRDVTDVRVAQRRLAEVHERLELAVQGTRDGVWFWNLETGRICISARFAEMLGYEAREFETGYDEYMALIHPEDRPRVERAFQTHLAGTQNAVRAEYRVRHRDGGWRWHLSRGASARDTRGRVVRIAGTTSDITQARETDEALRASEARFRVLATNAPFGIVLISAGGDILWANARLLSIYQTTLDEFRANGAIARIHAGDLPRVREAWARAMQDEQEFDQTYRLTMPDGRERLVRGRSAPVRGEDKRIAGHVGTVEDVTAWYESERARHDLERQVQHAQKLESLGVLAGGIAHDFNNLLVGILGNANLALLEMPETSPVRPLVEQIQTAAERSAELTRQMLAYAGRGQFLVKPVNLSRLVREISALLHTVVSKQARIEQQLDPAVPDVMADPAQVTQIVMNLLTNASDALDDQPGVITVRTRVAALTKADLHGLYLGADLPPGRYVCLEVADSGHGMSAETLARMFDPFFTTKFTGRGLGLAAVLGIVRSHRGALGVESAEGRGTSFRVHLPVAEAAAADTAPSETAGERAAGGLVLVVDDEAAVRMVARRFLERWGYEVAEAADGLEAVRAAEELGDRLRLAVVDLTMPRQDGVATLRALRERLAGLPIVLMSGYTEQAAGDEVDGARHVRFVQKPFTAGQLRRVVEEALADRG